MADPAAFVEAAAGKAVDTILSGGGVAGAVALLGVSIGFAVAGLFWWEARATRKAAEARLDECAKAHTALQDRRFEDGRALLVALERNTLVLQANEESRRGIMENMGELLQGFAKLVQSYDRDREQNDRIERQQQEIMTLLRDIANRLPRGRT